MKNNSLEILMLIKEIYLKSMYKIEESLGESGLTHQQIMVLKIIAHNKEVNISKLCDELCLSKGTVSGIVNRLEKADYIKKIKYDFDKRNTYVVFSTKGIEFSNNFRQKMDYIFNTVFDEIDDLENEEILGALKLLKSKMRN